MFSPNFFSKRVSVNYFLVSHYSSKKRGLGRGALFEGGGEGGGAYFNFGQ